MISKKFLVLSSIFGLFLCSNNTIHAQRRDREREKKENVEHNDSGQSSGIKSKLWYGGGINIGFGGYNGYSVFNFGLSPMVGYKIVGPLSIGPRVAYDFTSLKQRGYKSEALNSFDVGGFVRCRIFRGLFFQGELSEQWYQDFNDFTGLKQNNTRFNQRIGAGYNFGEPGGAGTEIGILYNFTIANDLNTYQSPVDYRFGITWRF